MRQRTATNYTSITPPFKGMGSIIHIVAWGLLFCLPFFFTGRETQTVTFESYIRFIIIPCSFMLVFYINYFLLIERYLNTKKIRQFILINILLIAVSIFVVHLLMNILPPPANWRPPRERDLKDSIHFFMGNAVFYTLVVGLSVAIRMTSRWYQVESERKELEKSRAEAELQNLKSQLNPHFLFNTLNNIYSLIAFSPERAQEAVHDLSRLLRYVLYESCEPYVPLEKEVDFIRNYVQLMRIRLPEHVTLETSISLTSPGMSIAPLLFIALIENAFKHGVSNSKPSFIHLIIYQNKGEIICSIQNSYFPKETAHDKSGSGIGLTNLQKRLSLLYPDKYDYISGIDHGIYHAILKITPQPLSV